MKTLRQLKYKNEMFKDLLKDYNGSKEMRSMIVEFLDINTKLIEKLEKAKIDEI